MHDIAQERWEVPRRGNDGGLCTWVYMYRSAAEVGPGVTTAIRRAGRLIPKRSYRRRRHTVRCTVSYVTYSGCSWWDWSQTDTRKQRWHLTRMLQVLQREGWIATHAAERYCTYVQSTGSLLCSPSSDARCFSCGTVALDYGRRERCMTLGPTGVIRAR
jgi:hypothetical protein